MSSLQNFQLNEIYRRKVLFWEKKNKRKPQKLSDIVTTKSCQKQVVSLNNVSEKIWTKKQMVLSMS